MITADDVQRITIFAELGEDDRTQLARAAADIALTTGEYAAQQGSERALFGLLDGCIEVVQIVDGVERIVGKREPGDIFGEVPIALGTVFPVGFRASEPSRVMRVEPRNFHTVAASAPERPARGGSTRRAPHERAARPAGARRRPGAAARDRDRRAHRRGHDRAAPFPRPQPGHVRVAHIGDAEPRRALGRHAPAPRTGPPCV